MMRLAVSNLAWPGELDRMAFEHLARLGVSGLEVAPTRLAGWEELTRPRLLEYRDRAAGHGLSVSSLQAILFGRNELHLLGDAASFDALCTHMRHVSDIATMLGAQVLVFGAPRNRLRGGMETQAAWDLACERFALLGEITAAAGVVIGIEPVPSVYGADFLVSWDDVLRMVAAVDSPGVRVHLDTGCVLLGGGSIGEAIAAAGPLLAHFHAAQPQLGDFAAPAGNHVEAARVLRSGGYDRWVAIEMREQAEDPIGSIETAVHFVRKIYFDSPCEIAA
jgi:sugar phosphate isomerase/epimerase